MPSTLVRGLVVAIAATAALTASACASDPAEEPTTSSAAPEASEESTEPAESEPAESESDTSGSLCTAEQLSSASGQPVPESALATATATFEPALVLGDLETVCIATFEQAGVTASFAVLPGAAETTAAVEANMTAAGAEPVATGDSLLGEVEGQQVVAAPLTSVSQDTSGFDNPEDLIIVVATPPLG